jgi:hypothetical protein
MPFSLEVPLWTPRYRNPHSELRKHWALVAHTCDPSYSGGRDQEDRGRIEGGLREDQDASPGKQFSRPYLEKTHHKKGLVK